MKKLDFSKLNKRTLEILGEWYDAVRFNNMSPQAQSNAFNAAFDQAMAEYNE